MPIENKPATPAKPAPSGNANDVKRDGFADEAEEDEWRHAPVAPHDEKNPLKSFGEAIADTLTGSENAADVAGRAIKPKPVPGS